MVEISEIDNNTLCYITPNDYIHISSLYKNNVLVVKPDIINSDLLFDLNLNKIKELQTCKIYLNKNTSTKLFKNIDKSIQLDKIEGLKFNLYEDIIKDEDLSINQKYMYSMVQATLNLMKRCIHNNEKFIRTNTLSLKKEYLYKVLKKFNKGMTKDKFEILVNEFVSCKLVKRHNKERIEINSPKMFCQEDSIISQYMLSKFSSFGQKEFTRLCIKFLYSTPSVIKSDSELYFTTTLKTVAKYLGVHYTMISRLSKEFKKIIKFQFITKTQFDKYKDNVNKEEKKKINIPYAFKMYANQKDMSPDENGEFKDNIEFYLVPVGSKLLSDMNFKSFNRTYTVQENDKKYSTNTNNMVALIEKLKNLDISETSSDETEDINFKFDENLQLQFEYVDYREVKIGLQQFSAMLGMTKNLLVNDMNLHKINLHTDLWKIDRAIRQSYRRTFKYDGDFDKDTLLSNNSTYRKIMDKTRAFQGSVLHKSKCRIYQPWNVNYIYDLKRVNEIANISNAWLLENTLANQSLDKCSSFVFSKDTELPSLITNLKNTKINLSIDERSEINTFDLLHSKSQLVDVPLHYTSTKDITNIKNTKDSLNNYITNFTKYITIDNPNITNITNIKNTKDSLNNYITNFTKYITIDNPNITKYSTIEARCI